MYPKNSPGLFQALASACTNYITINNASPSIKQFSGSKARLANVGEVKGGNTHLIIIEEIIGG